jgi:hypothetical protein
MAVSSSATGEVLSVARRTGCKHLHACCRVLQPGIQAFREAARVAAAGSRI